MRSYKSSVFCRPVLAPLLLLGLSTIVGCQPADHAEVTEATAARTSATVAMGVDIGGVNELVEAPNPVHSMLHYFALFMPLAEEQSDYEDGRPSFKPLIAESWQAAEDGLSYTFNLRRDLVWSDGEPITAADVAFTFEAQTDSDIAWAYRPVKARIDSLEVIDDFTVRFHYTENYPQQLYEAVQGVILPEHAWSKKPFSQWRESSQWFTDNLVVSGPFTLASWEPQQRFVLERNPRYFAAGSPKLDRIIFDIVPDMTTQLSLLRAGSVDFVELVPYAEAKAVEADDELYLTTYIPRVYYFAAWNNSRKPFDDAVVRRAMTLGIDRQAIIDNLFYGFGKVTASPFSSDIWAFDHDLEPLPYDPQAARDLLAEQGFADSDGDGIVERDGEPFSFTLMTNADNNLRRDIMVLIQSQLKKIGVDVQLRTLEFNSMLAPLNKGDFDAVVMGLSIGTDLDVSYNFHSRGAEGGLNWGRFSDSRVDELIDGINRGGSATELEALFHELQQRLHDQQPVTLLYQGTRLVGVRKPLTGVDPNAISSFVNLKHWHFDESAF